MPKFKDWLRGENKVLWCPGNREFPHIRTRFIPIVPVQRASEKRFSRMDSWPFEGELLLIMSFGISIIINHLWQYFHSDDNITIAFIYFDYKIDYAVAQVIKALLKQLAQCHLVGSNIVSLKRLCDDVKHPTIEQLLHILYSKMKTYAHCFVVINALDECPDATRLRLPSILSVQGSNP
jgi:hypothetical protein